MMKPYEITKQKDLVHHNCKNMTTTIIDRVEKFAKYLFQVEGILFCKFCQHNLSTKLPVMQNHMDSSKHKRLKGKKSRRSEKQITLQTSYKSLEKTSYFVKDFAKMCV